MDEEVGYINDLLDQKSAILTIFPSESFVFSTFLRIFVAELQSVVW